MVWRCISSPLQGGGLYHVFRSTGSGFHYSYITVITFRCIALQMVTVWLGLGPKTTWLGSGKDRTLGSNNYVEFRNSCNLYFAAYVA